MAKLTWLGSTEGYREGETPLDSCTWNGVLFTVGDKVEISDEWMIKKAKGNRFFKVEDNGNDEPKVYGPPVPPNYIPAPFPETWTNDPPRYPDTPPDYPPEDEPEREPNKKRRGRPPRIRDNGDGNQ